MDDDVAYRPVSRWAVAAVILAVISPVVLLFEEPLAWILPATAVVLAIAALVSIRRADTRPIGYRAAWFSLLLGIVTGVAGPVARQSRMSWALREASAVADIWLAHVQAGRRRAAHELTLPLANRCPDDVSLQTCYRQQPDREERLAAYAAEPDFAKLLLWGPQAKYEKTGLIQQASSGIRDAVQFVYNVELARDTDAGPRQRLRLTLQRELSPGDGRLSWRIHAVRLGNTVGN